MTITLLGASEIRGLANELQLKPAKSLGQNFVIDSNVCRKIVRIAELVAGDCVIEVGPGLGSLTLAILQVTPDVIAVEIDRRLAERLPNTIMQHGGGKIEVVTSDALDLTKLPKQPNKLVANLPYNVSVPVLLHFLEHFPTIDSGVVMVQNEVAERLAARPGSKSYGVPSAKAAWWCDVKWADSVSRSVFWPIPNVDSALVSFKRHQEMGDEKLREKTFKLIDSAFNKRRKMLRSALSDLIGTSAGAEALLVSAGIDPTARGESLDIGQYTDLARAWQASK